MIPTDPPEVSSQQWAGLRGKSAFDIGAHLGENIPFLRAAGCQEITALEPFAVLYAQLAARWPDVRCCQLAAWDEESVLYLPENDGMLGILAGHVLHQVHTVTLDWLAAACGDPDIVVVDVEGGEERVLGGATGLLEQVRPSWLIEFHTEPLYRSCTATLASHGYDVEVVRHPHYAPGSPCWFGHGWLRALR